MAVNHFEPSSVFQRQGLSLTNHYILRACRNGGISAGHVLIGWGGTTHNVKECWCWRAKYAGLAHNSIFHPHPLVNSLTHSTQPPRPSSKPHCNQPNLAQHVQDFCCARHVCGDCRRRDGDLPSAITSAVPSAIASAIPIQLLPILRTHLHPD